MLCILFRGILASIELLRGRFPTVNERCHAALELARATGLEHHRSVAMAHQFRGYVLFEWNRLAEAQSALERAWEITTSRGVRSGVARMLAAVHMALEDFDLADEWFQRLEGIVQEPMTLRNREWLAAVRMRHGLQNVRDLRAIDSWRQSYGYQGDVLAGLSDSEAGARLHEFEHLLTVLEEIRQWDTSQSVADVMLRASGVDRTWFATRGLVFRAVALEGTGRSEEADGAMRQALELGNPPGYVRAFVDGSPLRLRLLRRALGIPETRAFAERVLSSLAEPVNWPDPGPRPTPRQLQVLRHVAEGLSDKEVAERLNLARTTVKTHLRALYTLLGVGSRTAAVAKARHLGLL